MISLVLAALRQFKLALLCFGAA